MRLESASGDVAAILRELSSVQTSLDIYLERICDEVLSETLFRGVASRDFIPHSPRDSEIRGISDSNAATTLEELLTNVCIPSCSNDLRIFGDWSQLDISMTVHQVWELLFRACVKPMADRGTFHQQTFCLVYQSFAMNPASLLWSRIRQR